jgi:hypothetical protein
VKLTTHLVLVLGSRMMELSTSTCLRDIVLNHLSTGSTLLIYLPIINLLVPIARDSRQEAIQLTDMFANLFFNCPLYLQSVAVHSANVVKARRRVLTRTLLHVIGSESSCDLGSETKP